MIQRPQILKIKRYPDKILRKESQIVEKVTAKERALFQNMLCTMRHFSGIGLAAPQIGLNQRLLVVDIGEQPIRLANPEVVKTSGKDKMEEGCLSVPEAVVNIKRAAEIVVKGLNEEGKAVELKAKGLLARALLHEIDHLNGRLIVDYMNFFRQIKFKWDRAHKK